jgi:signal transduction histidine kinase
MSSAKDRVAAEVLEARAHLDRALEGLEHLPAFNSSDITFAAHALTNYLTVTSATVDLLLLALRDHPDSEVRTWLEGLRQATNLMTHTASQLMGTAAGSGLKLLPERVDLVTMARRCCDYYRRVAGRKQIDIACEAAVETPYVWADRVALAAILDNLLSNAVKYSPLGKAIAVQVKSEAEELVCEVRDQGPGLSAADRARLFQRGVRLSAVPTAGEPSTGFGLAVAKELIDQLGGQIACASEPGKGACFSIRLPALRDVSPDAGQESPGPPASPPDSSPSHNGD